MPHSNPLDQAARILAERRLQRSHDRTARAHSEEMWPTWTQETQEYRDQQIEYKLNEARQDLEAALAPILAENQQLRDQVAQLRQGKSFWTNP